MDGPGGSGPDWSRAPGRHAAAGSRRGGREPGDATAGPAEAARPLSRTPQRSVDGPDPVRGGGYPVPLSWRGPHPATGPTAHDADLRRPVDPWPALPDGTGAGRAGAGRPSGVGRPAGASGTTEAGTAHRSPWPALPDEPSPRASAARGALFRDARLDREQAGG
ncbi:hypothetical protein [Micromonospora schwarzwaldensis]|uniref:hypothetical protein n=1 Tax=Micromonospora sp. DSM 45708 TaxID=3111767 RepID=UPI0031DD67C4